MSNEAQDSMLMEEAPIESQQAQVVPSPNTPQPVAAAGAPVEPLPLPPELANPIPLPADKELLAKDRVESREQIAKILQEAHIEAVGLDKKGQPMVSPHHHAKIFDTHVEMQMGGISKIISMSYYAEMILSLLNVESALKINYELPFGTYLMGITGDNMEISCYYPEETTEISFQDGGAPKKFTVPLPNVVIHHRLQRVENLWRVNETKYFCTNKRVNELPNVHIGSLGGSRRVADGIWIFPFGNMHENGNMCFGDNIMPVQHGSNLRGLDYFYRLISLAPFNTDIGLRFWTDSHRSFYEYLATQKDFPYAKIFGI